MAMYVHSRLPGTIYGVAIPLHGVEAVSCLWSLEGGTSSHPRRGLFAGILSANAVPVVTGHLGHWKVGTSR